MGFLQKIYLKNFRNHTDLKLQFDSAKVLLVGPNGRGKTNLLEAIYFLSILRSFRTVNLRSILEIGQNVFELHALLQTDDGAVRLRLEQELRKRRLSIDGEALQKSSEFIRRFRAVPFVPEDKEIVSGASGLRRRFFDMLISVVDPSYRIALRDYQHALAERNAALKNNAPAAVLAAFDAVMSSSVPKIVALRREYSLLVAAEMRRLMELPPDRFDLVYAPDAPGESDAFAQILKETSDADRRRGFTMRGIQNDEFHFSYLGLALRNYGSTGQLRKIALYLKLAELELLRRAGSENFPVFALVDDVSGELDSVNRDCFFDVVGRADQSFFTFTAVPDDRFFTDAQRILF